MMAAFEALANQTCLSSGGTARRKNIDAVGARDALYRLPNRVKRPSADTPTVGMVSGVFFMLEYYFRQPVCCCWCFVGTLKIKGIERKNLQEYSLVKIDKKITNGSFVHLNRDHTSLKDLFVCPERAHFEVRKSGLSGLNLTSLFN
jgi:hypothetical protein